jgi:ubiquinone/menaquinone biosynthesis C-methylase UbiE
VTVRCDRTTNAKVYAAGVRVYDEIWSPVIVPPAEAVVRGLELSGARRIVDVGGGTGALSPALRAAAPDAVVVSIDHSVEMLRLGVTLRTLTAVRADAMALPLATASVDALLLAYVLFMLPDPRVGLHEARRVARRGGRLGIVTWANEVPSVAAQVCDAALEELEVPALPAHSNHGGLETTEAVTSRLIEAGLHPRRVWYESIDHTFDPDLFWRLRTEHGTGFVRLAALEDRFRSRVLSELRDRLASLGPADYRLRGNVVCAVAQT